MSDMTDHDFVDAFLHDALPPTHLRHCDHLRLSWFLIREHGVEEATRVIGASIRRFAGRHGQAEKYHETLTRFWVHIVGHHVGNRPDLGEFAAFLTAFPHLLDKDLPYRHWRRETLGSAVARAQWVEPDLRALPA